MTWKVDSAISLERFSKTHYEEYRAWFEDETMKEYLGHVDQEWLEYILNDQSGREFTAIKNGKLVGVVGITFPCEGNQNYVITNLAVNPKMKRSGLGSQIINCLVNMVPLKENEQWTSYVNVNNMIAHDFFEKLNWQLINIVDGMFEFRYSPFFSNQNKST